MLRARSSALLLTLLPALGALGALGCTAVLGIEDTTLGVEDAGPPPVGQDYTCVGATPAKPTKTTITLTVTVTDLNAKPLETMTVKVCTRFDTQCTTADSFTTDAKGVVALAVDTGTLGFDGSLEISGADAMGKEFLSVRWFFPAPLVADFALPVLMISEDVFGAIAAPVKLDDKAGQLTIAMVDCQGQPSSGVVYTVSGLGAGSVETYANNSAFVTKDKQSSTDKSGQAIVFNVPPGNVTVSTKNQAGQSVASFGLTIQAGKISTVILQPNL